jgi:Na+/H+-dicarboxylate symporter
MPEKNAPGPGWRDYGDRQRDVAVVTSRYSTCTGCHTTAAHFGCSSCSTIERLFRRVYNRIDCTLRLTWTWGLRVLVTIALISQFSHGLPRLTKSNTMNGIILLDEEAQRSLYNCQQQRPYNISERTFPRMYHEDGYRSAASGSPRSEPRTDFRTHAEPHIGDFRTDFTTGGRSHRPSPRWNLATTSSSGSASPRRDFASPHRRREPRMDFTSGPHTDFRTDGARSSYHSAMGKQSNLTHRSSQTVSATVDYTAVRDGVMSENAHADSYPILRDDSNRASSIGSTGHPVPDQNAGKRAPKTSARWVLMELLVGLLLGVLLSELKVSPLVAQWVALPGDLFIRALKCLVVPYAFCAVAVAVGDIVFVGKITNVGLRTVRVFVLFWVCTIAVGITVAMLFRPLFRLGHAKIEPTPHTYGFTCPDKHLLATMANGSISCSSNATKFTEATTFFIKDKNNFFTTQSSDVATVTLSDQTLMILTTMVSNNIIASLANSGLLSIITFSMLLGAFAGRSYFNKSRQTNYLYLSLLQLRNTFYLMMEWAIWVSPVGVVSMIAGSFANNQGVTSSLEDVYPLLLAAIACAVLQMMVVYPTLVLLLTRCNPFSLMKQMMPAYLFAFASASSLATMPVTLSCVMKAHMSSQSAANFVIPIGVVSGLSGMGWYLPMALTFLAEASGNGEELTAAKIFGMAALALLACAGTPPIPASSLVMISTAYSTLMGPLPKAAFAFVITADIIVDRISTMCNVNDDIMALKIISEATDETIAQDHLGVRF